MRAIFPSVPKLPKGIGGLIGLLPALAQHGRLTLSLFQDPRVSPVAKGLLVLLGLLIVSPLDLLNDIPVIGQVTDGFFVLLTMQLFLRLCPRGIVDEHIEKLGLRGKVKLLFIDR